MAGAHPPGAVARATVEFAVRVLPDLDDRLRYRAEFDADLHTLSRGGQLRYAAGVLSQTYALRAALASAPARLAETAVTLPATRIPFFRCRVFRWHRWVTRSTDDGQRYSACAFCGRLLHDGSTGGPNSYGFNVGGLSAP